MLWPENPCRLNRSMQHRRLIQQYFPKKIDLYGSAQSEPKPGFVLRELLPASEISLVNSYKKLFSRCCVDPMRPPRFSGAIFVRSISVKALAPMRARGWSSS